MFVIKDPVIFFELQIPYSERISLVLLGSSQTKSGSYFSMADVFDPLFP